jgi:ABC-type transporter Mla subunit MlaD
MGRANPALVVALGLAVLALVLLAGVMFVHLADRSGKSGPPPSPLPSGEGR